MGASDVGLPVDGDRDVGENVVGLVVVGLSVGHCLDCMHHSFQLSRIIFVHKISAYEEGESVVGDSVGECDVGLDDCCLRMNVKVCILDFYCFQ